jgi:hypothetical protein
VVELKANATHMGKVRKYFISSVLSVKLLFKSHSRLHTQAIQPLQMRRVDWEMTIIKIH